LALSTVSLWLRRVGLGKRSRLAPPEPPNRYERRHSGELVHVDIKQLGRISVRGAGHRVVGHRRSQLRSGHRRRQTGFEYVHVMVDDHSRLAYAEALETLTGAAAAAFLRRAVAWFAERGIKVERVMTDNGSCYQSKTFRAACKRLDLRQIFTKPYTPKTNGKAERFIQTALREWAYAQAYQNSDQRTAELLNWLHRYNWHRPHGSLKANTPISRLGLAGNNLLRLHS
jgi:transposase InsO family protein